MRFRPPTMLLVWRNVAETGFPGGPRIWSECLLTFLMSAPPYVWRGGGLGKSFQPCFETSRAERFREPACLPLLTIE